MNPATGVCAPVDVLIPTYNRPAALAVTLSTLGWQTIGALRIVVSDQSDTSVRRTSPELKAVIRYLEAQAHQVQMLHHLPRRGLAEQRAFLLAQARSPYALFLDDDILLEPNQIERLLTAIREQGCGFVGAAPIGLSYADDVRPHEQAIEFWDGPVQPERIDPGGPAWSRHRLHNAANLWHLQRALRLTPDRQRLYKVAWVGGCVLFDCAKLRASNGFDFWPELPCEHCGEDVLAQLRVMRRWGGCAVIPSGAYHQELPTTVPNREVDAPHVLSPV